MKGRLFVEIARLTPVILVDRSLWRERLSDISFSNNLIVVLSEDKDPVVQFCSPSISLGVQTRSSTGFQTASVASLHNSASFLGSVGSHSLPILSISSDNRSEVTVISMHTLARGASEIESELRKVAQKRVHVGFAPSSPEFWMTAFFLPSLVQDKEMVLSWEPVDSMCAFLPTVVICERKAWRETMQSLYARSLPSYKPTKASRLFGLLPSNSGADLVNSFPSSWTKRFDQSLGLNDCQIYFCFTKLIS